jgi:hypothetical protein
MFNLNFYEDAYTKIIFLFLIVIASVYHYTFNNVYKYIHTQDVPEIVKETSIRVLSGVTKWRIFWNFLFIFKSWILSLYNYNIISNLKINTYEIFLTNFLQELKWWFWSKIHRFLDFYARVARMRKYNVT